MRLYKFLTEAVIKPDLYFLSGKLPSLISKIFRKGESSLSVLNSEFKDYYIEFKKTSRQSSDDEFAAAGISYATTDTKEPFKITIYMDDFSVFDDKEDIDNFWVSALYRILGHELIHRQQFAKMKIKKKAVGFKSFKEYYADEHEIMALAYDTFIFFLGMGYSKKEMISIIQTKIDPLDFVNLKDFLSYFAKDSKEYKLLTKYIYEYIQKSK